MTVACTPKQELQRQELEADLYRLARKASEQGFVLTIDIVSVPPLAAGRHRMRCEARAARSIYNADIE